MTLRPILASIEVTYMSYNGGVTVLIEEHVPRHSQQIDPPWWEEHEFDDEAKAKAWVDDQPFSVVKETKFL